MNSQFSTISVPNYRKSSSYNSKDVKTPYSSNNDENFYNLSCRKHRERISTYDKIIHELSKDERKNFGTPLLSIIGGNEANIMNPNISTGKNTNVGGTLTLYPSGGILFKNFTSLKQDLPDASSQQSSETKDISARGSSPVAKSPRQLLDFVEKFNMEEDESLSPDDFLEYRDSQSDDLTTESGGTIQYGNTKLDSDTTHRESETIINDLNYNNFLDNQTNKTGYNQIVGHREERFPNTLGQLNPLPIISFPLEASSLKNKVSNTSVFNTFDLPEILINEKIKNITNSSVADSRHTLDLMSRVRSISISSINSDDESINLQDKENISVSPMSTVLKTESLEESDATNNSTSNWPIPPTRNRKLSESLSGFFTGFFGSSPTQTLSERSEHIKEVAEMSMIFRY